MANTLLSDNRKKSCLTQANNSTKTIIMDVLLISDAGSLCLCFFSCLLSMERDLVGYCEFFQATLRNSPPSPPCSRIY